MKTPEPTDDEINATDVAEPAADGGRFGLTDEKKKKIKKILLIVVPILIIIIGGACFYFFILKAPKPTEQVEIKQPNAKEAVPLDNNTYLDINPITLSLASTDPGAKKEYLRIDLTIRLGTEEESVAVLAKMPIIKDSLITFLGSLRSTDFNSSSSTLYLKEEISRRINKIAAPIVIKEVLFQEITVN